MVGWHHRLNGHEFEQTSGDSEGQGSLAFCSPWGHKESDTTEQLNNKSCAWVTSVRKTKSPVLMELHTSGMMFSLFGRPQSDESHEEDEEVAGTNNEELVLEYI